MALLFDEPLLDEANERETLVTIDLNPIEVGAILTREGSMLFRSPDLSEAEKEANAQIHRSNYLDAKAIKKIEVGEPIEAQNFSGDSAVKRIVANNNHSWIIHTEDGKKYLFIY